MKGELGRILALLGLSASLVSCALVLGINGEFVNDEPGAGGGRGTGSGTAAGLGGAPGDINVTTGSDVTSGPSGPSGAGGMTTTTSSVTTTSSGPTTSSASTTTSTSSTGSGGGPTCPPGSVVKLADDFSNSAHTFSLWTKTGSGSADVASGVLTLNGPAELFSTVYYPIINCQASVMLKGMSGSTPNAHFNIKNSAKSTCLQIFVDGSAGGYISFTPSNPIKNCPYDTQKHRFWRFRATASTMFVETSGDGIAWTDTPCGPANGEGKFSLSQLGLTDGQVEVHLGTDGGSQVIFDNFDK